MKMSQRVKIRVFPIMIAYIYWSGFRIFKQNLDNPDEIERVRQSVSFTKPLIIFVLS